jgi:hypothetical protein
MMPWQLVVTLFLAVSIILHAQMHYPACYVDYSDQDCQIFLGIAYQNIPNDHKLYQMAIKCTIWP